MRINYRRNAGGIETVFTYAASTNGAAYTLEHLEGYSVTAAVVETAASLVGTLKLQASNNAFDNNVNNGEAADAVWVDIPGSTQSISGTGNFIWNVSDVYYKAVRVVWTRTSGTGTFDIIIVAKGPQS